MTAAQKVARRKLTLLQLSNVSEPCRISGYSRQQFYEVRRHYQACPTLRRLMNTIVPTRPAPS